MDAALNVIYGAKVDRHIDSDDFQLWALMQGLFFHIDEFSLTADRIGINGHHGYVRGRRTREK